MKSRISMILTIILLSLSIPLGYLMNINAIRGETTENGFSPKLQMTLDSFIQKYPSPVYYVLSETFDTCTVVTFGTTSAYSVNLVDCYIKDKKHLITYYSVDSIYDKSLINKDKMTAFNEKQIKGFRGDTVLTNCHSYVERYCVSKGSMRKMAKKEIFVKYPQKAKANDVFASKEMNLELNSFINRQDSYVTEIRFFQYQHERYVAFYPNIFYDISLIDAYFFRNGHFVAIYGLKEAPQDWIRKTAISCYKGSIPKIRCSKKTIWYLPFPDIFMIKDGKMIRVDDFKSFLLIGECFG